jgi:futalosine hydrolase
MILLVHAVEQELSFWQPRHDVDLLATGVGPVEAACAVAHALAQQRYRLVVNAGVAGALDAAGLRVGQGVVVSDDAMELDLESGHPIALPDGQQVVDKAHSDRHLVTNLAEKGFAVVRGLTVARVTCTEQTAERLALRGAQVESMEGFAVLRCAERAGVPAIELRGISNRVGSRERSDWNFHAGLQGLQHIMTALFGLLDAVAEQPA